MAKGILGKSRTPQEKGISNPHLRFTDAMPRDDLRDINHAVSYSRPTPQVFQFEQSGSQAQLASDFDFRADVPVSQTTLASNAHLGVDESMIGIALGSPRMLQPHNIRTPAPPIPPTLDNGRSRTGLQRKPSKWRKIGGLFKAKHAMAPNANQPFYQVRAGDGPQHQQDSTHSVDYQGRRRPWTGSETGPIENTEVWPCLVSENEALTQQGSSKPKAGTFLQVEIPQVEMERYSVMFGGLLSKSQPSLLDRRSKTLDNLTIPGRESPPPAPQRRATSPALSRSPNFTLFPTMPVSKASKILGTQNLPQAPNPQRRTQSSLANRSQETLSAQRTLTPDIYSKSRSFHRAQGSVTSFLSGTSIGSNDEPLLIHKVEPIRTFPGMKEPNWDIINRKPQTSSQSDQPAKNLNLTINTREIRSRSDSTSSDGSTITATSIVTSASSPIMSPMNTSTIRNFSRSPPRTSPEKGTTSKSRSKPRQISIDSTCTSNPGLESKPIFFPPPRTSSRLANVHPFPPSNNTSTTSLNTTTNTITNSPPSRSPSQTPSPPNSSASTSNSRTTSRTSSQAEIPTIEVSIARSVSVSRGKKQMIVPVRTRAPTFNVAGQARAVMVSGPMIGHRPGLSQDARIEMV
ncbi:uncharacterized protein BDV14DRAFT_198707 [Aspergillus stella-maris]|uniref:uncharacterized protein n=1 Tax=Aspergillus stella-maris TaxID=1810926 RepID=UPI003CCD67B5